MMSLKVLALPILSSKEVPLVSSMWEGKSKLLSQIVHSGGFAPSTNEIGAGKTFDLPIFSKQLTDLPRDRSMKT
jgi:hypothetical protein